MKNNKSKLAIIVVILFFTKTLSHAQTLHTSVNATGGDAKGVGGSISYSIGQVFYTNFKTKDTSITEGVQQPYEISILTDIDDMKVIEDNSINTYPNPVNDFFTIKLNNFNQTNLSYQLSDLNGKLYDEANINNIETKVDVKNFSNMVYLLNIISNNKIIKVFKIIKL